VAEPTVETDLRDAMASLQAARRSSSLTEALRHADGAARWLEEAQRKLREEREP
jgi:hypothetical protein